MTNNHIEKTENSDIKTFFEFLEGKTIKFEKGFATISPYEQNRYEKYLKNFFGCIIINWEEGQVIINDSTNKIIAMEKLSFGEFVDYYDKGFFSLKTNEEVPPLPVKYAPLYELDPDETGALNSNITSLKVTDSDGNIKELIGRVGIKITKILKDKDTVKIYDGTGVLIGTASKKAVKDLMEGDVESKDDGGVSYLQKAKKRTRILPEGIKGVEKVDGHELINRPVGSNFNQLRA